MTGPEQQKLLPKKSIEMSERPGVCYTVTIILVVALTIAVPIAILLSADLDQENEALGAFRRLLPKQTSLINSDLYPSKKTTQKVCNSLGCRMLASAYIKSMNRTVHPCSNFYDFVCDGWKVRHRWRPEARTGGKQRGLLETIAEEQNRIMVEKLTELTARSFRKIGDPLLPSERELVSLYVSCLRNGQYSERRRDAAVLNNLLRQLGLEYWLNESPPRVNAVSSLLHASLVYGLPVPLLEFKIEVNVFDSTSRLLYVTPFPKNNIFMINGPAPSYRTPTSAKQMAWELLSFRASLRVNYAHLQMIDTALKLLNRNWPIERITATARNVYAAATMFEAWRHSFQSQGATRKINLRSLSSLTNFNWIRTLNEIVNQKLRLYAHQEVVVDLTSIQYLIQLAQHPEVSVIISDYLTIMVIMEITKFSRNANRGQIDGYCRVPVAELMPQSYGALFVREMSDEYSKSDVQVLISELNFAMAELLRTNVWMDYNTKRMAMKKLDAMIEQVSYADHIVKKDYIEVPGIPDGSFIEKQLHIRKFNAEKGLQSLRQRNPRNASNWKYSPAMMNAIYDYHDNSMLITASIMTFPFYIPGIPPMFNLAGLGGVIAHEMIHGFDQRGSDFDAEGKYASWWSPRTKTVFEGLNQCFIQQYHSLPLGPSPFTINGYSTLAENIADNGAMRSSWKAYQKRKELGEGDYVLPGLEWLTPDQLFFVSKAYVSCGFHNDHHEYEEHDLHRMQHAPLEYRVNEVLANLEDFASVFKCSRFHRMVPQTRCVTW